jgi:hypothetical protein
VPPQYSSANWGSAGGSFLSGGRPHLRRKYSANVEMVSDPLVRCSGAGADQGSALLGTVNLGPAEGGLGRNDGSFLDQSGARHLRPNKKGAGSQHPVIGWPQQVPPDLKEIQDDSVDRQESLRLSGGRR